MARTRTVTPVFSCVTATIIVLLILLGYQWKQMSFTDRNNYFDAIATGECSQYNNTAQFRQNFDLRIIIIAYNRPHSMLRLLNSLNQAQYDGDRVMLEIWIDRSKSQIVHEETLKFASGFSFDKGYCRVIVQQVHVGLRGQWLSVMHMFQDAVLFTKMESIFIEFIQNLCYRCALISLIYLLHHGCGRRKGMTWTPVNNSKEIAVILEDDLTVSPYFYKYLKLVHNKYRQRQDVSGFSLQGTSIRHSDGACCLNVPPEHRVFLYPTIGTWGFSPNTQNWIAFLTFYRLVTQYNLNVPLIENHISSVWYKMFQNSHTEDSMWEMEYLYFTRKNKEYTLYPNFPGHRGLTLNWLEKGLHYSGKETLKEKDEAEKLLLEWTFEHKDLPEFPVHLDDKGNIVIQN